MQFYTDTNGVVPTNHSKIFIVLGLAMKSMPIESIDFSNLDTIEEQLDKFILGK